MDSDGVGVEVNDNDNDDVKVFKQGMDVLVKMLFTDKKSSRSFELFLYSETIFIYIHLSVLFHYNQIGCYLAYKFISTLLALISSLSSIK